MILTLRNGAIASNVLAKLQGYAVEINIINSDENVGVIECYL